MQKDEGIMKVMITGAKGMLGSALTKVLKDEFEVISLSHADLDVTSHSAVKEAVNKFTPDIIIHCAAWTDVDGCENDDKKAFLVNYIGTQNIVYSIMQNNCKLVYISTDYVFDGKKKIPYYEFDKPNPINIYGKSKLAGEMVILHHLEQFYIVRTSWLFGKNGKNFVKTILNLAKIQNELKVVDDQRGSPTYALDLAKAINELIKTPFFGIYHITNSGFCSWYDFAKLILKTAKISKNLVPIKSSQLNCKTLRPENSILENYFYNLRGFKPLRSFKEALKDYLHGERKCL